MESRPIASDPRLNSLSHQTSTRSSQSWAWLKGPSRSSRPAQKDREEGLLVETPLFSWFLLWHRTVGRTPLNVVENYFEGAKRLSGLPFPVPCPEETPPGLRRQTTEWDEVPGFYSVV